MMKDIPDWEGKYAVTKDGRVWSHRTGTFLKNYTDSYGYHTVGLYDGPRIKRVKVHRLVAAVFIPNPCGKPQVNHKNGIKADNRVENLEWATSKENSRHAWGTGLMESAVQYGEKSHMAVLTRGQVLEIKKILAQKSISQREIAKRYGVHFATISAINVGKSWAHL